MRAGLGPPFKIAYPSIWVPGSIPKIMGVFDMHNKVTYIIANSELCGNESRALQKNKNQS